MESRQDMSPALRRRFQTGRDCLDFTHTGGDGEFAKWELLQEPIDVERFLGAIVGVEPPRVSHADMGSVFALRSAIASMARSLVATGTFSAASAKVLNKAAESPPLVPALTTNSAQTLCPGTTSQIMSRLARDAIDLFSSPLAQRIRVCEAEDCGLLFVDASRPGRRRWCSMQWCGDREKKRTARGPIAQEGTS